MEAEICASGGKVSAILKTRHTRLVETTGEQVSEGNRPTGKVPLCWGTARQPSITVGAQVFLQTSGLTLDCRRDFLELFLSLSSV